jgi:hypothetical protein
LLLSIVYFGVLVVAECIETSFAAVKIFGIPVWSGLSAGGVRGFIFPPGLKKLLIFADRGEDGESAATELCRRALAASINAWIYLPHGDDDFADDLTHGECRADDYHGSRTAEEQPSSRGAPPPDNAEIIPPPRRKPVAATLTKSSPELQQVLKACVPLNPLERSRVLQELKESTRYGIVKLEQMVKGYRKEAGYLSQNAGPRPAWVDKLKMWDNGEPQPIQLNIAVALREDPAWRGVIGLNEFTGTVELLRHPPWPNAHWRQVRDWTDGDTLKATEWVQGVDICAPKSIVSDAVESVANENPFHPVRDWLDSQRDWLWAEPLLSRTIAGSSTRSLGGFNLGCRPYLPPGGGRLRPDSRANRGSASRALQVLFDGDSRSWFADEIAELGRRAMQMAGICASGYRTRRGVAPVSRLRHFSPAPTTFTSRPTATIVALLQHRQ